MVTRPLRFDGGGAWVALGEGAPLRAFRPPAAEDALAELRRPGGGRLDLLLAWARDLWAAVGGKGPPGALELQLPAGAASLHELPWELLALLGGQLLRRVGDRAALAPAEVLPVLLVVARPELAPLGPMDPRGSAAALAAAGLPFTVAPDGSWAGLQRALAERPFRALHFDGHGRRDPESGRVTLAFEGADPGEPDLVDLRRLAGLALPLLLLEACDSASPVAGGGAVVSFGHAVDAGTTGRFLAPFYAALARGGSVGEAVAAGRGALGGLERAAPVLYLDGPDRALVRPGTTPAPRPEPEALPGRAAELVAIRRRLRAEGRLWLHGVAGIGKTALARAVERWFADLGEPAPDLETGPLPPPGWPALRVGPLPLEAARDLAAGANPAADEDALQAFARRVHGNPRSLRLLAPHLDVPEEWPALVALQDPGWVAGLRAGLAGLGEGDRQIASSLAVFLAAAHVVVLAAVAGCSAEEAARVGRALHDAGIAEADGHYILVDPALLAALGGREPEGARARWLDGTLRLLHYLYAQLHREAAVASHGLRVAWPELRAAVEAVVDGGGPEAAQHAVALDQLAGTLGDNGQRRAAAALRARAAAAAAPGGWSAAAFNTAGRAVEQALRDGDLAAAQAGARALVEQAEAAGDQAPWERALAPHILGRALVAAGRAAEALGPLERAGERFARLAADGDEDAGRMVASVLTDLGLGLRRLGRLDAAASAFEEAARAAGDRGADRVEAAALGHLGAVQMLRGDLEAALGAHERARARYQRLGDGLGVATAWHQRGLVLQRRGAWDEAATALHEALALRRRLAARPAEAETLSQLGALAEARGHLDDAAALLGEAVALRAALGRDLEEARSRKNLARVLLSLGQRTEAEAEARRAAVLEEPFGHAAQPWTTWETLAELDAARPSPARKRAVELYLAYREDGGEPLDPAGRFLAGLAAHLARGDRAAALAAVPPAEAFEGGAERLREAALAAVAGDPEPARRLAEEVPVAVAAELLRLVD